MPIPTAATSPTSSSVGSQDGGDRDISVIEQHTSDQMEAPCLLETPSAAVFDGSVPFIEVQPVPLCRTSMESSILCTKNSSKGIKTRAIAWGFEMDKKGRQGWATVAGIGGRWWRLLRSPTSKYSGLGARLIEKREGIRRGEAGL